MTMNVLIRHLETNSVAFLRSRSVAQCLPCVYCSYERKWRNFSTLQSPQSERLLQRDPRVPCVQYRADRPEHSWSVVHAAMNGAQAYFEYVHAATGLDWWASLIVAVIPIRIVLTCWISHLQTRNMRRIVGCHLQALPGVNTMKKEDITPERIIKLAADLKAKSPEERAKIEKEMHEEIQRLYAVKRCHPFKNFGYGMMTLPMWVSGAFAIRNMTGSDMIPFLAQQTAIYGMADEGCLWFPNLLLPDDLHILPVLEWVMMQLTLEFAISNLWDNRNGWVKYFIYFLRFWQIWTTIFVAYLWHKPSGLIYYWVLTTSANLGTNLMLMNPRLRRKLGFPVQSETPYRDLARKTYNRYNYKQRLRDRRIHKQQRKAEIAKLKAEIKEEKMRKKLEAEQKRLEGEQMKDKAERIVEMKCTRQMLNSFRPGDALRHRSQIKYTLIRQLLQELSDQSETPYRDLARKTYNRYNYKQRLRDRRIHKQQRKAEIAKLKAEIKEEKMRKKLEAEQKRLEGEQMKDKAERL